VTPIRLLAVGSTLIDLRQHVNYADIEDAGLTLGNSHLVDAERMSSLLDRWPFCHASLGGSTANTVRGFVGLGGVVDFVTQVGDDGRGLFAQQQLAKLGVNLLSRSVNGDTGVCLDLITPDGERTMVVSPGVASQWVLPSLKLEHRPSCLLLEGYLLDYSPETRETFRRTVEWSRQLKTQLVVSLSDRFVVAGHQAELLKVASDDDPLLIGNEGEFRELFGDHAIEYLRDLHVMAAITRGPKGATVIDHDGNATDIAAESVSASDTTGAGDMFAAGLLFGLASGVEAAGRLGVNSATRHVGG
jgi:sugar/nucleoside kinase (ribokinase family)